MKLSAVLLAGGESRRMGKDKATAFFQGKPLWQIQLNLLRELRLAEIFLSARSDPDWRPADVKFVADEPPSRGPLSGVAASLGRIRTKHLLALAIDMPFMSEKYLRFLCDQIEPRRGVLPMIGGRAEPLAAIYPKGAHVDLVAALSGLDFSLQTVTQRLVDAGKLRPVSVKKKDQDFFRNINEPADLHGGRSSATPINSGARRSSPLQSSPRQTDGRKKPAHFPTVESGFRTIIIFLTVCTHRRRRLLANKGAVERIINAWQAADFWRVGRYVIMPDHIHLFCVPNTFPPQPLKNWIAFWKNHVTRAWPDRDQLPIWQRDFWDRQLRRGESYGEKWEYVENNPVRHGHVARAEDWPYQGELNILEWHDR